MGLRGLRELQTQLRSGEILNDQGYVLCSRYLDKQTGVRQTRGARTLVALATGLLESRPGPPPPMTWVPPRLPSRRPNSPTLDNMPKHLSKGLQVDTRLDDGFAATHGTFMGQNVGRVRHAAGDNPSDPCRAFPHINIRELGPRSRARFYSPRCECRQFIVVSQNHINQQSLVAAPRNRFLDPVLPFSVVVSVHNEVRVPRTLPKGGGGRRRPWSARSGTKCYCPRFELLG